MKIRGLKIVGVMNFVWYIFLRQTLKNEIVIINYYIFIELIILFISIIFVNLDVEFFVDLYAEYSKIRNDVLWFTLYITGFVYRETIYGE